MSYVKVMLQSVWKSQINKVCQYIINQDDHHRKRSFTEKHDKSLKPFGLEAQV